MTPTRMFHEGPYPVDLDPLGPDDPSEAGPYRLAGVIGAGGMGSVFAGVDSSGRCVAVKLVHPEYAADREFRSRFAREVALLKRVRATCTVQVLGADTDADRPWLATEYVPGQTLGEHVRADGPLAEGALMAFCAGIAEALVAMHAAGVVHRDLKPGNVILAAEGPKVLDFGIARALDETAVTRTGGILGTPGWMAPELFELAEPQPSADVFAWGALAAYAATGRSPFGTATVRELVHRTRQSPPDLLGVPGWLLPLVRSCLARDPRERPSARWVLGRLRETWRGSAPESGTEAPADLSDEVTQLLEDRWTGVVPRWRPRRRVGWRPLAVAAGMAVLVPLSGAVGFLTAGEEGNGGDQESPGSESDEETSEPVPFEFGEASQLIPSEDSPGSYRGFVQGDSTFVNTSVTLTMIRAEAINGGVRFHGIRGTRIPQMAGEFQEDAYANLRIDMGGFESPDDYQPGGYGPYVSYPGVFTVDFFGAPDSGVIALQLPFAEEDTFLRLCYQLDGEFSADLEECT